MEFTAYRARLAPDGMLAIAVVDPKLPEGQAPWGSNTSAEIYLVEPTTLEATYVATGVADFGNWPFGVSADHVFWTNDYCSEDEGRTQVLDRRSGSITELDRGLWAEFTPEGHLAVGPFGAETILRIDPLEYVAVLPFEYLDVQWSPDYRYAAVGLQFGHGGFCGV